VPFLLTGLEVTIAYPANRFTLPLMLGVSLVLAGLLALTPPRLRVPVGIALIALAAGRQALWAEEFRHDWSVQRTFFWQMIWRAPGIAPNTIVLLNEGAMRYSADNSLTGALNWIYDPHNRSDALDYVVFYPTSRVGGSLVGLQPGQPVIYDFIAEVFAGNTGQALAFYFQPPGCLRLLDPEIDVANRLIPEISMMREAAHLSFEARVLAADGAIMPAIYGPEPSHGWCYYFERAHLAVQGGDWQAVANLGDEAFRIDDYPNDPMERFVFIEGYAHTDEWRRAVELSGESFRVSRPYMGPLLCKLWSRIERETASTPERDRTLVEVKSLLACAGE
jgi:hypothetical protein